MNTSQDHSSSDSIIGGAVDLGAGFKRSNRNRKTSFKYRKPVIIPIKAPSKKQKMKTAPTKEEVKVLPRMRGFKVSVLDS